MHSQYNLNIITMNKKKDLLRSDFYHEALHMVNESQENILLLILNEII